ncbi:MAG: metal-dependent hydrolase [Candidatus Heimdallarchaeaceae archaeon]|jgi:membrane-bound metal-dependent hydrolase YbcI (DUF457 family)
MSRRLTHIVGGLVFSLPLVGLVYYLFTDEFDFLRLTGILTVSFVFAFAGSILPDIIERPRKPDHRRFFHSWFMLAVIFIAAFFVCFLIIPRYEQEYIVYPIFGLLLGYLSHLLLDSTTKISLT